MIRLLSNQELHLIINYMNMITTTFITFALCQNLYFTSETDFRKMNCNQRIIEQSIYLTKQ